MLATSNSCPAAVCAVAHSPRHESRDHEGESPARCHDQLMPCPVAIRSPYGSIASLPSVAHVPAGAGRAGMRCRRRFRSWGRTSLRRWTSSRRRAAVFGSRAVRGRRVRLSYGGAIRRRRVLCGAALFAGRLTFAVFAGRAAGAVFACAGAAIGRAAAMVAGVP